MGNRRVARSLSLKWSGPSGQFEGAVKFAFEWKNALVDVEFASLPGERSTRFPVLPRPGPNAGSVATGGRGGARAVHAASLSGCRRVASKWTSAGVFPSNAKCGRRWLQWSSHEAITRRA